MPPREGEVQTAGASIVHYERWRETQDAAELGKIQSYNEDDCRSTHLLRDWLLEKRPAGLPLVFRRDAAGGSAATTRARGFARREAGSRAIARRCSAACPAIARTWAPDAHLRELVFDLLDFHRRAAKPAVVGDVHAPGHEPSRS